jgi:hypothetical protein
MPYVTLGRVFLLIGALARLPRALASPIHSCSRLKCDIYALTTVGVVYRGGAGENWCPPSAWREGVLPFLARSRIDTIGKLGGNHERLRG